MLQKIGEKGGNFGAGIREKGGKIWILEHEYVPFLGPRGGGLGYYLPYSNPIFT